MNLKEFIKKRYDLVRQSEALGVSILIHAAIAVAMAFVIVSSSEKMRDAITSVFRKPAKKKIEQPKPVVLPKNIPVNIPPPPPKMKKMQKLEKRMVVKRNIKSKLRPKTLSFKKKTKIDFKTANNLGKNVKNMMYRDYAAKHGVEGGGKTLRAIIDKIVLLSYEGGDWDCEFHHYRNKKGKTVPDFKYGSLANLIREIDRRTNIEVKNKTPVVVRADSPEIFDSPFVYITGHKDFKFTDAEIENLRTYILQGGAIVANSSLPGRRSRFDVAFRREMKRVIPDHDLKPINNKHSIYNSFAVFKNTPMGMNYWQEPLEIIDIDGRVVVIYNLNDYGDFMLATLDSTGNAFKTGLAADAEGLYRWEGPRKWHNDRKIYANVDDFQTTLDAYLMNINILSYLLTR
ncbi:MAG: hypothetical protein DRI44_07645 [Chlamydiae bacterium]|nr:MAG: hypothetical protein DRI44_07645 [Chlamydiota bacterium]